MSWLDEQLRHELVAQETAHLRRHLRTVPHDVLDLASNDYLGLSRHPEVVEAACQAARQWGGGARASRLLGGHTPTHTALEAELADWKECEAALVFSSGYAANISVVTALAQAGDLVLCDKRNHASLVDACRLAEAKGAVVRYFGSLEKLQSLLEKSPAPTASRRLIVSDTVYSMDGDVADVPALMVLGAQFAAILILDDAHGSGTLGADGSGACKYFEVQAAGAAVPVVQIGTLSKALGSQGGFVCGSRALCEWLVNTARPFIYSTGLNPAACGAALAALRVLRREPQRVQRLKQKTQQLAHGLEELGLDAQHQPSPIVPLLLGEAERALRWSNELLERGVWCPAVRPPTVPRGASRLRITAHAELSEANIKSALSIFAQVRDAEKK
ncbi:MAG: 8-amino-7-oxononanoate synthase [Abditibacteriota bacterium]|nr:8-amino-7-oxononanoate synthase [Abditibacteriota bacterium]